MLLKYGVYSSVIQKRLKDKKDKDPKKTGVLKCKIECCQFSSFYVVSQRGQGREACGENGVTDNSALSSRSTGANTIKKPDSAALGNAGCRGQSRSTMSQG